MGSTCQNHMAFINPCTNPYTITLSNRCILPLPRRYPSALAALRNLPPERLLPIALLGSGQGGDCAPKEANYQRFFSAVQSAAWCVELEGSGHFSFTDSPSALQRAVCPAGEQGEVGEAATREVSRAVLAAWGEAMVRHRGATDGGWRGCCWCWVPAYLSIVDCCCIKVWFEIKMKAEAVDLMTIQWTLGAASGPVCTRCCVLQVGSQCLLPLHALAVARAAHPLTGGSVIQARLGHTAVGAKPL